MRSMAVHAGNTTDFVGAVDAPASTSSEFGCHEYPHISAATPPTCPDSCRVCTIHYVAARWQTDDHYAFKYSDEAARHIVQRCVQETQQNLEYVRRTLMEHGNALLKRWQKRSADKRAALLRRAMPEMQQHRFFETRFTNGTRPSLQVDRKSWLLPYLSVETLSQDGTKLLALIHARSAYSPAHWIASDIDSLRAGFDLAELKVAYNPHCVVVTVDGFGDLVQWDSVRAHTQEVVGFPRAQLAIEAQSELSRFLRNMVEVLLSDAGGATPQGRDRWDTFTANCGVLDSDGVPHVKYYDEQFGAPCRYVYWPLEECSQHLRCSQEKTAASGYSSL